jgi:hypothetical protein
MSGSSCRHGGDMPAPTIAMSSLQWIVPGIGKARGNEFFAWLERMKIQIQTTESLNLLPPKREKSGA